MASPTSRDCSSNTEYFGLMSTIELFCSHFRSIGESNVAEVRLHAQQHLSGQSPTIPGQTWDRPELSRFYRQGLTSSLGADAQLVPLSANASVPSCAPSGLANGTPSHAVAVDHNHTRPTAHTRLRDRSVRLMKRCERHCLCGGSQSQAEHSNSYCSDHCFLPVRTVAWSATIAVGRRIAQDREKLQR